MAVASLGAMRWAQSNCLFYLDLCTGMAVRNGTFREGLFVIAAILLAR